MARYGREHGPLAAVLLKAPGVEGFNRAESVVGHAFLPLVDATLPAFSDVAHTFSNPNVLDDLATGDYVAIEFAAIMGSLIEGVGRVGISGVAGAAVGTALLGPGIGTAIGAAAGIYLSSIAERVITRGAVGLVKAAYRGITGRR